MNSLRRILAASCVLAAVQTFAAGGFEGKVTFALSADNSKPQVMDYAIKGQKMRMDIKVEDKDTTDQSDRTKPKDTPKKTRKFLPGFLGGKSSATEEKDKSASDDSAKSQQVTTIMDMEKMEMLMLMPEQKMYMVMPVKKIVDKAVDQAEKDGDLNSEVERTGKTEKILGYTSQQILVTDKEKKTVTEMWITQDLGTFMGLSHGNGGGGGMFGGHKSATAAKWEEALKGKGGFPLRVVTKNSANVETYRMEATKVEPGPQPDALFVPPDDYQKFSMPGFGDLNPFKQR